MAENEFPKVMTVPEAGAIFGLKRRAAYYAAEAGQLPTVKIGRRKFVPAAALEAMLSKATA